MITRVGLQLLANRIFCQSGDWGTLQAALLTRPATDFLPTSALAGELEGEGYARLELTPTVTTPGTVDLDATGTWENTGETEAWPQAQAVALVATPESGELLIGVFDISPFSLAAEASETLGTIHLTRKIVEYGDPETR